MAPPAGTIPSGEGNEGAALRDESATAGALRDAHRAVELGQKHGADAVRAGFSGKREVEFTLRDGVLEKVQESVSQSLSIELYVDGRYSVHSTTSLKPERVESFVEEAVALTRALEADSDRKLADPKLFEGRSEADLEIFDSAVFEIDADKREAVLRQMDEVARADERVISATSYFSDAYTFSAAASSNGFEGVRSGTALWIGAEVTVRGEGDRRPEGGHWIGSRMAGDQLDPKQVAQEALDRAILRLGSTKGPTARTTMVVDPQQGWRMIRSLLGPANARAVHQGRSFWNGKLGERVAPEILTIVDDPLLKRGLASRSYDGEGIASRPLTIVEAGVAKNLYVDTYYGRKTGMAPTTGGRTNILVKSGVDKGLTEILADVGEGIYVTSWLGGNSDRTTGDFSFGLRGHLVENGRIAAPVGELNVTGNLLELMQSLVLIGNDPWPFRSLQTPTMVFEGVQFSGA